MKPRVFVTQAFSKDSDYVYRAILDAASNLEFELFRPGDIVYGESVLQSIQRAISEAAVVVADVSEAKQNVLFELGWAQGLGKPIILIATSLSQIPFDVAGYLTIIADSSTSRAELITRISGAISRAIDNPQAFTLAGLQQRVAERGSVFISYCHRDSIYLDRLLVHLKPLERSGRVQLWADTRLRAGDKWKDEIQRALEKCSVAILMISADFLASDFITKNELPPLLSAAEEAGTRIIPVIVKPCRFVRDPHLSHFQAANPPDRSIVSVPEAEQEALYDSVAAQVEAYTQKG